MSGAAVKSSLGRGLTRRRGSVWHRSMLVTSLSQEDLGTAEAEEKEIQEILKVSASHRQVQKTKVSESDGNFFENFSQLPKKQESLHFRKAAHGLQAHVPEQTEDDVLASRIDHPCKDIPQLSKKEVVDLYRNILSVIHFRLGAVGQSFPADQELYGYLNDIFKACVSISEHNSMVLTITKGAPPDTILLVTVQEARDLVGKDVSGLSDPFCVMGILPTGESKKPFVTHSRGSQGTCSAHSQHHGHKGGHSCPDLQSTSIVKEQLNPKWNENFRFVLECDVHTAWFHIDVWDHDEETTVMEVVKKSGDIQNVKGVKRLLKEVIQSTRLGGSNPDDFLGYVNIKLDTIPSWGWSAWFSLKSKSSRSKSKSGEIYLKLKMSLQRANQSYQVLSPTMVHRVLWFYIVHHEVAKLDQLGAWDGELPAKAKTILQQHAVQYEISDLHQALCRWLAYSQECTMCVIDFRSFYTYGETLKKSWKPYALSADEEQYLQSSFHGFITYALYMLRRQQDMFPPTNKPALRRLRYLLLCLSQINDMEFAERNMLFQPNCQAIILDAIKDDIRNWYCKKHLEMVESKPETEKVASLAGLTNAINGQAQRLLQFVHSTYQTVFEIPYFTIVYQEIAQKLMADVSQCLTSCVSGHGLDDVEGEEYSERSTALFELYLALRDFVGFAEHLSEGDQADLEIKEYHKFFKKAVEKWLNVARKRAQERIQKAVELDQVALVDTMVKHSTSAVDVATCFAQIREFWQKLDWPDTVGSYVFVAKVTDDICHGAVSYANIIHDKLRQKGYYDDEGQFDITDQLCIAINNIEQVRRSLAIMPKSLGWQRIQVSMETEYGEMAGRQCQDTLHTMMTSADEDMVNVIEHVVQRVGERMRPDFRRFLRALLDAHIHSSIDDAIDPLMEYLDTNMITLHNCLLKSNFDRILQDIWIVLVDELGKIISSKNKVLQGKPLLFCRINETLEILSDFFYADEKGLPLATLHNRKYIEMKSFAESNMADTYELIEAFHAEKLQAVEESTQSGKESELGMLTVKCYYNDITKYLCVMLVNARNIQPKDKSGTSDPYVVLELQPSFVFPKSVPQKSKVIKETVHPLFDEAFEFPVTKDQCTHRGACLHFIMYDYDVITADDFEGETFLALDDIPGIRKGFDSSYAALNSVPLPLMRPEDNNNAPFLLSTLKQRTTDRVAQEFAKKRGQLLKRAKVAP
ncbi:protein unc-13 homolog D-like isoform X2 [Acanthaster planci]|uniref:Protein unc-13 homolog D-like isoform X2 n=1 Tax=Acanthaster planci TaxID=133434 RepID=A0A8B7YWB9_ACAPL|nr:protein unc-13 homolog D-like isoform X2 [Acanthaster planci]